MELKDIYPILSIALSAIAIGVTLIFLFSRIRNDKYDYELKKIQIDAMRQSLELKSYEANATLMSDPKRWKSINHLLVESLIAQEKLRSVQKNGVINTSFFESVGLDIQKIEVVKRRVFVLTPFHPRYENTYKTIKNACTRLKLECMRGDEQFKPGAVLSHILELIAEASTVIVNIDGRNPNVYYELGIAHAMGKPTILVSSDISAIPFDMQ